MKCRRILSTIGSVVIGGLVAGCAFLTPLPKPTTVEQRLAVFPTTGLPISGRVTVHWDRHQIPFVEAESDDDAAFALGLVHAHLRLGQMETFRRISQGRIAEMAGPLATDIDHGLRIIDFGRASAATEAQLPAETRIWLTRFVAGINHYQRVVADLPYDFDVLGLEREPWTIADILTFGRLAGTDVNWLVWFNLLRLRDRSDWSTLWARLVANGSDSLTSFDPNGDPDRLGELLGGLSHYPSWGATHRLGLAHPLSFLPLIGDRYRFADFPIGGSTDTLMKTAHGAASELHFTRYGSNARHISDLSDLDRNYFVLLGGQDGQFNSASFLDQAELWVKGSYIEVPLRLETVYERFAYHIRLAN